MAQLTRCQLWDSWVRRREALHVPPIRIKVIEPPDGARQVVRPILMPWPMVKRLLGVHHGHRIPTPQIPAKHQLGIRRLARQIPMHKMAGRHLLGVPPQGRRIRTQMLAVPVTGVALHLYDLHGAGPRQEDHLVTLRRGTTPLAPLADGAHLPRPMITPGYALY